MADPKVRAESLAGDLANTDLEPSLLTPFQKGIFSGIGLSGLAMAVGYGIRKLLTPKTIVEAAARAIGLR